MGLDNNNPIVLTVVTSGASFARSFSIKVTQIECNSLSKGNPDDTMIRGVIDTFVVLDRYLQLLHRKQFNNLSNDKHKTFPMSKGSDANNYHFYFLAGDGCLQYFTGVSGQMFSFNYNNAEGLQLSNTDYTMCVRMERNFCGIQYTACPDTANTPPGAFSITGGSPRLGSVVGTSVR